MIQKRVLLARRIRTRSMMTKFEVKKMYRGVFLRRVLRSLCGALDDYEVYNT